MALATDSGTRRVAAMAGTYAVAESGVCVATSTCATNRRHSSWLLPSITGTRLKLPLWNAARIVLVRTTPSTFGLVVPPVCLARIVGTGRLRRHSAVWLPQPAPAENA